MAELCFLREGLLSEIHGSWGCVSLIGEGCFTQGGAE